MVLGPRKLEEGRNKEGQRGKHGGTGEGDQNQAERAQAVFERSGHPTSVVCPTYTYLKVWDALKKRLQRAGKAQCCPDLTKGNPPLGSPSRNNPSTC